MSNRLRLRLAGMALLAGGLVAGTCHLYRFESPMDLAHVGQYSSLGVPVHLALFTGGLIVLLGWVGQYVVRAEDGGSLAFAAFMCLFAGIFCGDLVHSILEFSVFPVVDQMAPYALPGLADATYRSMPVLTLLNIGRILLFAGAPAAALAADLESYMPRWPAIPFALTAVLQALAMVPGTGEPIRNLAFATLYFSMATLGVALLCAPERAFAAPITPQS